MTNGASGANICESSGGRHKTKKNFRKQGLAKESLQLIIDYCFNVLMLKQIFCFVDSLNIDSLNLFKNIGFEQCGYRKEWIKTPEGFIDEYEFQYINKNF